MAHSDSYGSGGSLLSAGNRPPPKHLDCWQQPLTRRNLILRDGGYVTTAAFEGEEQGGTLASKRFLSLVRVGRAIRLLF